MEDEGMGEMNERDDAGYQAWRGSLDAYMRQANLMEDSLRRQDVYQVAALAATLAGGMLAVGRTPDVKNAVLYAQELLAESRRQAAATAGERHDG